MIQKNKRIGRIRRFILLNDFQDYIDFLFLIAGVKATLPPKHAKLIFENSC
jgi:hypothetical protein